MVARVVGSDVEVASGVVIVVGWAAACAVVVGAAGEAGRLASVTKGIGVGSAAGLLQAVSRHNSQAANKQILFWR